MIAAPDHPATWSRYAQLAPMLRGEGLRLSANDYDFAAVCVNAHQALIDALHEAIAAHQRADPHPVASCTVCQIAAAAIAKAEGGA